MLFCSTCIGPLPFMPMKMFFVASVVVCASCSNLLPSDEDGREIIEYEESYLQITSIDKFELNSGNFEIHLSGSAIVTEQIAGLRLHPKRVLENCGLENRQWFDASDFDVYEIIAVPGDQIRFSASMQMISASTIEDPELKRKADGSEYPETKNGWTARNYRFAIRLHDDKRWVEGHPSSQYFPVSHDKGIAEAIILGTTEFHNLCNKIDEGDVQ